MKAIHVILYTVTFLFMVSCEKQEGIGGSSSISGKIQALEGSFNPFTSNFDTTALYYLPDENVYIIYGNDSNQVYDDDFETSWDGTYRFDYLRKGSYTLFTYSKCDSCISGSRPIFWSVDITENNKNYIQNDKTIIK